ncbi:hypothetical protein TIFTF001_052054 [Ficus carica]|uniref:Uncharacterized protein n=1 Tax=Ficus carica TaxID=3494 RepID=A0AA88EK44_FICCA|nr:hypothetical protein TIFTF001_052051 [Ficus carica]GMN72706.1 hypothetical protein TIFTF001_052052 [Ficus carica]GMN72712.1 hypothetical protein TIFTF001_052053 [Ficus carica]GMN72717.1 hypothetical protein TIFTF001_052054 [Ficus carica]
MSNLRFKIHNSRITAPQHPSLASRHYGSDGGLPAASAAALSPNATSATALACWPLGSIYLLTGFYINVVSETGATDVGVTQPFPLKSCN